MGQSVRSCAVRYSHVASFRGSRARSAVPRGSVNPSLRPALALVGRELDDGHRRRRAEIVRTHQAEELLREAGKLPVELQVHPGREERETLEEPLDVGVGALERVEPEAPRDLGKVARELASELPQIAELAVVILEQSRVHELPHGHFGDVRLAVFQAQVGPQVEAKR